MMQSLREAKTLIGMKGLLLKEAEALNIIYRSLSWFMHLELEISVRS